MESFNNGHNLIILGNLPVKLWDVVLQCPILTLITDFANVARIELDGSNSLESCQTNVV